MARKAFLMILVGLVFSLVDIVRYEGFDLLPDLVGYGLIFLGLGPLAGHERKLRTARRLAAVLIVLSPLTLYEKMAVLGEHGGNIYQYNLLAPLVLPVMILHLVMVWYLFAGTSELAFESRDFRLGEDALNWRNLYVAVAAMVIACQAFYLLTIPYEQAAKAGFIVQHYLRYPMYVFELLAGVLLVQALWQAGRVVRIENS
ncbi:MAG: hypothetical protein GWP05_09765 [Anaerolineaceae bacterium]|nr:hypothetical protein [Anaerolineaceae bacterium]